MKRIVQPTSGAIRAANRVRVVDVLRHAGSATRAELVAQTGLSRATISSLVGDLSTRGLVSEQRTPSGHDQGRPTARVALNRSAGVAIAVDVGVRHVAVAVGDLSRTVLTERWTTLPRGHGAAKGIAIVVRSIEETLSRAAVEPEQLIGAAISIAAPVATDSERLLVPGVLPGWNGSELASRVAQQWNIPVVMENDANLGALAEAVSRSPSDDGDLLYVKVASRVGLGVAFGAQVHRGRDGYAGELGHVTAEPDGDLCWCGRRGCLELYAGGDGMLRRLGRTNHGVNSIAALVEQARAGHDQVLSVISDGARAMGRALGNVSLVLNPSTIVLGGELAALGALLADPIRAELASIPFGRPIEVRVSELGERASLVGALAVVLTESSRFIDRSQALSANRSETSVARL